MIVILLCQVSQMKNLFIELWKKSWYHQQIEKTKDAWSSMWSYYLNVSDNVGTQPSSKGVWYVASFQTAHILRVSIMTCSTFRRCSKEKNTPFLSCMLIVLFQLTYDFFTLIRSGWIETNNMPCCWTQPHYHSLLHFNRPSFLHF